MAATSRSVREYLDTLDDAAWGAASEVRPKFISKSDPAAQWTGALKGHAFFAYAANYLIDLEHDDRSKRTDWHSPRCRPTRAM